MDIYSITFARSARKELESLPNNIAIRILNKIQNLSSIPRPHGWVNSKVQMLFGGFG